MNKYFAKYLPVEGEIKDIRVGTRVKYLLAFGAKGTITSIKGDRAYTDENTDGNGEFHIPSVLDKTALVEIVNEKLLFLLLK